MAHKTLVNATAYEISGGRTLVNGTGYSIDKGKTLVGGTAYEVGFGVPCTVTILAYGISPVGNANVTIDGQTYSAKGVTVSLDQKNPTVITEVIVPSGTVMSCSALVPSGTTASWGVSVNGTTVASQSTYGTPAVYDYVVNGNVRVVLREVAVPVNNLYVANVEIIEDGRVQVFITGSGSDTHAYVDIDGVRYSSAKTLAVPIGTVMTCHVSDKYGDDRQSLKVNGVELAKGAYKGSFDYEYTVSKTVSIDLTYTVSADKVYGTLSLTD